MTVYDDESSSTSQTSPDESSRRTRKKYHKKQRRRYYTPCAEPLYYDEDIQIRRAESTREAQVGRQRTCHHHHRSKARKRSIDINIRTLLPQVPPCEPVLTENLPRYQQERVGEAPFHTNWNSGYHPSASRNTSLTDEECREPYFSSYEDEPHGQYWPTDDCSENNQSNPSFFTKFKERCVADREVETKIPNTTETIHCSESSKVDITITMDENKLPLQSGGLDDPRITGHEPSTSRRDSNLGHRVRIDDGSEEYDSDRRIKQQQEIQAFAQPRNLSVVEGAGIREKPYVDEVKARQEALDRDQMAEKNRSPPSNLQFPFRGTPSGNLKIDRNLVTFQSPNVAVLVADPGHMKLSIKNDYQAPVLSERSIPGPSVPPLPSTSYKQYSENQLTSEPLPPVQPQQKHLVPSTRRTPSPPREEPESHSSFVQTSKQISGLAVLDRGYESAPPHKSTHYGGQEFRGSKVFGENLHYRIKRAIHPDTTVIIGDEKFPVHGIALQCYSSFVDKIHRRENEKMKVEIPQSVMSSKDFPSLMDWIVMADCEKRGVVSKRNVISLYSGAAYLGIPQLQDDCIGYMKHKIEDGDTIILQLYEEAKARNCGDLVSILATKLAALFPIIYKSKQFLRMLPREIILILSADNITIKSELDVYDAAARWLLFDWDRRREYTVDIMKTVRFGLLTSLQLTQLRHSNEAAILPDYQRIFEYPEIDKMLDKAMTYAILKENYHGHPGELQRWLNRTKVTPPRERGSLRDKSGEATWHHYNQPQSVQFAYDPDTTKSNTKSHHKKKKSISEEVLEKSARRLSGETSILTRREERPSGGGSAEEAEVSKEKVEAAVLIQSAVRGWLARRRFKKMRKAVIVTQAALRAAQKRVPIKPNIVRSKSGESLLVLGGYNLLEPIGRANSASVIYRWNASANIWKIRGHLPEPKARHGVAHLGNFVYVFGGEDPSQETISGRAVTSGATWALDLVNGTWTRQSDMRVPRSYFSYALAHGKIYVFGGLNEDRIALASSEVYDPIQDTWIQIQPMNSPRVGAAVAKSGDKIWIVGGLTQNPKNPMLKSVLIYDYSRNIYYNGPDLPYPWCNGTLTTYYNKLVLIGGATYNETKGIVSIGEVSQLENSRWITAGQLRTGPRHLHSAVRLGKYVLLLGGANENLEFVQQVESYNIEKFRGASNVARLPVNLSGLAGVVISSSSYSENESQ